jgi:hypothetical protein
VQLFSSATHGQRTPNRRQTHKRYTEKPQLTRPRKHARSVHLSSLPQRGMAPHPVANSGQLSAAHCRSLNARRAATPAQAGHLPPAPRARPARRTHQHKHHTQRQGSKQQASRRTVERSPAMYKPRALRKAAEVRVGGMLQRGHSRAWRMLGFGCTNLG